MKKQFVREKEAEYLNSQIAIYKTGTGVGNIEVHIEKDSIWLTQKQIAELFEVGIPAINKHIANIYKTGELKRVSTISKMEIVQNEGSRRIQYVPFLNILPLVERNITQTC
ncbi:MAG: hypothetical protein A2231_01170 [Candidatus Firestonebacteria bacterium RIFOXYA2_FULL_40_8]|nr:MAG: hypothetical protein A2231_01170 [Candidatus Firestonebacteria bacterium RIFOXYA2_FULL_40_8]